MRLSDLDVVGRLLLEAVARTDASVDGPAWRVDPDNLAQLEAYRLAAEDARRRAAAYAGALGLALGEVLTITEPEAGLNLMSAGIHPGAALAGDSGVPVNPGSVEVHATVEVTFALGTGSQAE